jgi:transcriptional regulator with XRE-family HTH domain
LGIMTISPAQCRAARGLVELDQALLAESANLSRNVIVDFEKGRRNPTANNLAAIRRALEAAGVEFIAENGGGAGVRLRKNRDKSAQPASIPVEKLTAENDE